MQSEKSLIIVTRALLSGGAERVIAQISNYLVNRNMSCEIITLENNSVFYSFDKKVKITPIGKLSGNKLINKIKQYMTVRRLIKAAAPDLVLSLPEETGIYVVLAMLGLKTPICVSERNNPWVMPDKKPTRMLRLPMYRFAKGIIFQTKGAMSFFPEYIQKKGVILKNPVDLSRIPAPYKGEREKAIVSVGRLEPQKNMALLIDSFKEFSENHPDYRLVIYGEGSQRDALESQIRSLGLESRVYLPGRENDVLNKINSASMFVLSSDYEGMPNALLEAMCMGMPVISTDCPPGGPRELIDNNTNGIIVPVGDKEAMTAAMNRLADSGAADEFAAQAYLIKDSYDCKKTFEEWEDYILKMMDGDII